MKINLFSFFLVFSISLGFSQQSKSDFYSSLVGKDSLVDYVLRNRDKFHLQFIVTDIERDEDGNEVFNSFDFSTNEYFYPASMVKLPTAIATLEMLDSMQIQKECFVKMNKDVSCGSNAFADLTQKQNIPIGTALEDMLSISDNYYYSMFFHMITPLKLNDFLLNHQITNSMIYSSFSGCPRGKDVETNSFSLINAEGKNLFSQEKTLLDSSKYMYRLPYMDSKLVGKYQLENGNKMKKPYDFNYHLDYPLKDIHSTVFRLVFPQHFNSSERFDLSSSSRKFLLKCMANYPREMQNKSYHNIKQYPDNYYKYAIIGNNNELASSGRYRTFSKIGIAYGFVTESAYVVDFVNRKDFLFSVSLYVNTDETINDGTYEYEKIARPFIANFSRIIQEQLSKPMENSSLYSFEYFKMIQEIMQAN
jgi:hypothetical protein